MSSSAAPMSRPDRSGPAKLLAGVVVAALVVGCSGSDGGDENNRITRIDGPATVSDDGGAELDE